MRARCATPTSPRVLREIALFLEMEDVPFKPRAYEKAAHSIETHRRALRRPLRHAAASRRSQAIPGIGKSIAEKIAELLTTGKIAYHEELRARTPIDIDDAHDHRGRRPESGANALYQALGVTDLVTLEAAATERHASARCRASAPRARRRSCAASPFAKQHHGRFRCGDVLPVVATIEARIAGIPGVERAVIAGSIRRRRETVGDADIVVIAADAAPVMERGRGDAARSIGRARPAATPRSR